MGETVTYLGHVDIKPSLNQAEYDYLEDCFGLRPREVGYRVAGAPDDWCGWGSCPHGCCLSWDGREKFHAGPAWLAYLIDELLRPGARGATNPGPGLEGFTFDHRLDGLVVGERSWSRKLFAIRVVDNVVSEELLRPGEPLAWEPGWDGLYPDDRPWLAREPRPRSRLDDPPPEVGGLVRSLPATDDGRPRSPAQSPGPKPRQENRRDGPASVTKVGSRD